MPPITVPEFIPAQKSLVVRDNQHLQPANTINLTASFKHDHNFQPSNHTLLIIDHNVEAAAPRHPPTRALSSPAVLI